jgi:hypothetical protein
VQPLPHEQTDDRSEGDPSEYPFIQATSVKRWKWVVLLRTDTVRYNDDVGQRLSTAASIPHRRSANNRDEDGVRTINVNNAYLLSDVLP